MVDGRVSDGRFVSHVSYGAYASAVQLEAQADFEGAEGAYQEALRYDMQSPQIWTRLGSVRCASGKSEAESAFDKAEQLAPEFALVWYERGVCELGRGESKSALERALTALALDPEHLPTTKLIADCFVALGRPGQALRYLDALVALHPHVPMATSWREALRATLGASGAGSAELAAVDRAILNHEPELARQRALELGLSESQLAARRALLGETAEALEQAGLVRAADPADGTAWATELAAADLLRKEAAFERALSALDENPVAPSPLGQILFADLLKRRVGPDAARAWLNAAPVETVGDELLKRHRARLEHELAGANHGAEASENEAKLAK
jgi:hypothetical protein